MEISLESIPVTGSLKKSRFVSKIEINIPKNYDDGGELSGQVWFAIATTLPDGNMVDIVYDKTIPISDSDIKNIPELISGIDETVLKLQAKRSQQDVDAGVQSNADEYIVWQNVQNEGYVDQITNIKLKTTIAAQTRFASMIVLVKEAIDLGFITNDSNQTIYDYNEQPHTMTTMELRQLMLRYGLYCKYIFDEYAP